MGSSNSREVIHRKCGLHRDQRDKHLECFMNNSTGNDQIFVGTRWAGRPGSGLSDSIITCSVASELTELFQKSECRHSAPKFDVCALERVLDVSLPFLHCFFCFLAGSRARDDCKRTAIISHIRMVSSLRDMDSERCSYPSSQGYLESDFFFHVHCTKHVWCMTSTGNRKCNRPRLRTRRGRQQKELKRLGGMG